MLESLPYLHWLLHALYSPRRNPCFSLCFQQIDK
nr:MAG TPA: hypothetical protein [Caudoviricetes sp.]DAN30092.1 MAG TPA: hypothetical protein [Caudoviricetes sp.]DAN38259.1 MAG TPA: hypothetical protein [Caudoviricetes sp.]DAR42379.1 MAG TPA: hypothetical protein [Caudoviricetes sp.]DAS13492.1 MAG TPA: hypothetical protein [Caudoviricetes sp.]